MAVRSGVVALAFAGLSTSDAARFSKAQSACGAKGAGALSNDTSIPFNGEDAPECAWKWQVGLRYGNSGMPFCGGTLINEDWVLTAAHCSDFPDYNIAAGDWKPRQDSNNVQNRRAVQLIIHPGYVVSTDTHDYALVRVDRSFDFNSCVGAACLPETADIAPGSSCMITGWAGLAWRMSDLWQSSTLQQNVVTIRANDDCGDYTSSIDDSMLCAQGRLSHENGRIDACQGDSGGPLVCEDGGVWTLYGASSWTCGFGTWRSDNPGVFARVHYVMDWVNQVLADNAGPPPPPPTRPRCPDFAVRPTPDRDGDCSCPPFQRCSTNGGATVNCPSSGGIGVNMGMYFFADCDECMCYSGI